MHSKTRTMVVIGMLGALTVVMGLTGIGFIPIPPVSATIMHLPVILAGVLEGPLAGAAVGAIFGGFSMYQAAVGANPVAKVLFLNPLIALVPRILIGIVAAYGFRLARSRWARTLTAVLLAAMAVRLGFGAWVSVQSGALALSSFGLMLAGVVVALVAGLYLVLRGDDSAPGFAAMLGTLTNTVGVLSLAVAFKALPAPLAWTIGLTNSPAEVFVAMTITVLVYQGVTRALGHRRGRTPPTVSAPPGAPPTAPAAL